jgi:hypothetical protein
MKKTLLFFMLLCLQSIAAQKYITRSGTTSFKASVAAFEPIEAINKSSSAVINDKGDFAALLLIKGFHFKVALMQEHFNENYMDSDKFSKATFKGKLVSFSLGDLNTTSKFSLKGTLTIKGKTKEIKTEAIIIKQNEKLIFKTTFSVAPEDFRIKIPGIVRKKIAKEIQISIDYELTKM